MEKSLRTPSNLVRHFFHLVSNVRPLVWICVYVCLIPLFALIYWALPDGQFRIPDNAGTDFGSWLYYSIVTISTLGFGDYTPAHGWAQCVTAVEVVTGLAVFGFFLNSVGSMKSDIDVLSEREHARQMHIASQEDKIEKSTPLILHNLNLFLSYCYAVTTPLDRRAGTNIKYNPDFKFSDMVDLYKPSGLPVDQTHRPAVENLLQCARKTSLFLDAMQNRIDLTPWPELLEDCFSFVANTQMFSSHPLISERLASNLPGGKDLTVKQAEEKISKMIGEWQGPVENTGKGALAPIEELYTFIKQNAALARHIETQVTQIASGKAS